MTQTQHKANLLARKREEDELFRESRVPHVLYLLYDEHDTLLYVGITNDVTKRMNHHRRHKSWWPHVARTELQQYRSRSAALYFEACLIHSHQPVYNIHGRRPDAPPSPTQRPRRTIAAARRSDLLRHATDDVWNNLIAVLRSGVEDERKQGDLDPRRSDDSYVCERLWSGVDATIAFASQAKPRQKLRAA